MSTTDLLNKLLVEYNIDVDTKIAEIMEIEDITLRTFHTLDAEDWKQLGMNIGTTKVLLHLGKLLKTTSDPCYQETNVENQSSNSGISSMDYDNADSAGSSKDTRVSTDCSASGGSFSLCSETGSCSSRNTNLFDVRGILSRPDKRNKKVKGSDLIKKLDENIRPDKLEKTFITTTLGSYLMENCAQRNKPSKAEKIKMALSIVTSFPVMSDDDTPNGYDHIFDSKSHGGSLGYYISTQRSRNPLIDTVPHKRSVSAVLDDDDKDAELFLRQNKLTSINKELILNALEKTREQRRAWISQGHPTITDIIKRYPRFGDMKEAITTEFEKICSQYETSFEVAWRKHEGKIYEVARVKLRNIEDAQDFLRLADCDDDDNKTIGALLLLPFLLQSGRKRGKKEPRLSPAVSGRQIITFVPETMSVYEALDLAYNENNMQQPGIVVIGKANREVYLKLDKTALQLKDVSCFAECIYILLSSFFTFGVEYPYYVKLVYLFLEKIMRFKICSAKSSVVNDLLQEFKSISSSS